jgi:hypothetical protein
VRGASSRGRTIRPAHVPDGREPARAGAGEQTGEEGLDAIVERVGDRDAGVAGIGVSGGGARVGLLGGEAVAHLTARVLEVEPLGLCVAGDVETNRATGDAEPLALGGDERLVGV